MGRLHPPSRFLLSSSAIVDPQEMHGLHMIVTCSLHDNNKMIKTHALIDCGATGYAFIDKQFARRNNLPLYKLKSPRTLHVIDGRQSAAGDITHITKVQLQI